MLANITFKAYSESIKNSTNLLTDFTLHFADTESIDKITQSIEKAYECSCPISWTISIDHEYI